MRKEIVQEIIQCVVALSPTITFVMDFVDAIVPWQCEYKLYYL
jgi:hypothetical protein